MPDTFVVTTPTTTVTLGAAPRTGQVAFTVSNIAGRPLRTRLRLVPQEPAKAEWLVVQGGDERTLALGATENFAVTVTVPPDVPAGNYTFRADAVGEDSPDEDFEVGPTVSLTVPAAVVKPKFPWWIVAAAAAVLIVGVVLFVVISKSGKDTADVKPTVTATPLPTPTAKPTAVAVPAGLVNLAQSAATTKLTAAGFKVDVQTFPNATPVPTCDPPVGAVFPASGQTATAGSTVILIVSPIKAGTLCVFFPTKVFTLAPLPKLT
jgi:hypothetical protein